MSDNSDDPEVSYMMN